MATFTGKVLLDSQTIWIFHPDKQAGLEDIETVVSPFFADYTTLLNCGTLTNNLPVSEDVNNLTGCVLPSFSTDYYYRIHITPNPLNVGNVLADTQVTFLVWNSYFTAQELTSVTPDNDTGLTLNDTKTPPYDFFALEERLLSIDVSKEGPEAINATYAFEFPAENPILTVVGFRAILWPFPPIRDIKETRVWLTDVIKARLSETRTAVREIPRVTWGYDFKFRSFKEFVQAESTAHGSAHFSIGLPLWTNVTKVALITTDDLVITFDTTKSEIRVDDNVLIWKEYDNFETVTVTAVDPAFITLLNPVQNTFVDACVMPIATGNVPGGINFDQKPGHRNSASLSCTVIDNYVSAIWPSSETLDSLQIVTIPAVISGGLASRYQRETVTQDSVLGTLAQYSREQYTRTYKTISFIAKDYDELYALRRQVDYLQGKFISFWVSTFRDDFINVDPLLAASSTIRVEHNNWNRNPPKAIRIIGDSVFSTEVTAIVDNLDGTESLTITPSLSVNINDVKTISVMTRVRSDSDSFELLHQGGIQRLRIPVVEVLS